MADSPINLRAHEVRAILKGRQTQVRRVLDIPPQAFDAVFNDDDIWCIGDALTGHRFAELPVRYRIGDRLRVRETFSKHVRISDPYYLPPDYPDEAMGAWYWADGSPGSGDWETPKSPILMPRWASRLTLIVTDVRVQRLQEISKEDAVAEGAGNYVPGHGFITGEELHADPGYSNFLAPIMGFEVLWNSINAKRPGCGWDDNPWVVALTFRAINQNIDQIGDGDDH